MTQEDWDGMTPEEQLTLIDSSIQADWDECQNDIEDIIYVCRNDEWNAKIGARMIVGHLRGLGYIIEAPSEEDDQ